MTDKERRLEEHEKINVPYWVSLVRWFKVGCMPTEGRAIVYASSNNKVGVIANVSVKRWNWYVEKYSIIGWCYSADLLPNMSKHINKQ